MSLLSLLGAVCITSPKFNLYNILVLPELFSPTQYTYHDNFNFFFLWKQLRYDKTHYNSCLYFVPYNLCALNVNQYKDELKIERRKTDC